VTCIHDEEDDADEGAFSFRGTRSLDALTLRKTYRRLFSHPSFLVRHRRQTYRHREQPPDRKCTGAAPGPSGTKST
jgi:hypothetical protein